VLLDARLLCGAPGGIPALAGSVLQRPSSAASVLLNC
jgi:hypothetical protein